MCCAQVQTTAELLAARVVFGAAKMSEVEKVVRYLELATLHRLREAFIASKTAQASVHYGSASSARAADYSIKDKTAPGLRAFSPLDMLHSVRATSVGGSVGAHGRSEEAALMGTREVTTSKGNSAKKKQSQRNAGSSRKRGTQTRAKRQAPKARSSLARRKPAERK